MTDCSRAWCARLATVLVFSAAVAVLPGGVRRAAAIGVDAECLLGTFNFTYTPALTATAGTIASESEYAYSCVLGPTSGASAVTLTLPNFSCLNLLAGVPAHTEVVTWTGGTGDATSTIRYTSVMVTGQTGVLSGTVIAGRFNGDLAEKILTTTGFSGTGIPLLCPIGLGTVGAASGTAILTLVDPS